MFCCVQVLVCSDSMSRGMDLPSVQCVVNYDVPSHFKSYLHRVGRTARAGAKGNAYTILTHDEVLLYNYTYIYICIYIYIFFFIIIIIFNLVY